MRTAERVMLQEMADRIGIDIDTLVVNLIHLQYQSFKRVDEAFANVAKKAIENTAKAFAETVQQAEVSNDQIEIQQGTPPAVCECDGEQCGSSCCQKDGD